MASKKQSKPTKYYTAKVEQLCFQHGLLFDKALLDFYIPTFLAADITQKQFDTVMKAHVEVIGFLFTPQALTWKNRIALAAYFLGIIDLKKINKKQLHNEK